MDTQAEHAQALQQEHTRSAAIRADFESQLKCTQQQVAEVRLAAEKAQVAESHATQSQQESASAVIQLQVHYCCMPACTHKLISSTHHGHAAIAWSDVRRMYLIGGPGCLCNTNSGVLKETCQTLVIVVHC